MISPIHPNNLNLPAVARECFDAALAAVNPERAIKRAVKIENENLLVAGRQFDLREIENIYSVALGKAAFQMARGLTASLGGRLRGGVISGSPPNVDFDVSGVWQVFCGGHPLPNAASLAAARAAFELLEKADALTALVVFLVSGGGSAMMELPADEKITLAELQETNCVLVTCGATIAEVNALRRRLSQVKGGRLSRAGGKAQKITFIVSDTNTSEAYNVAAGPTITSAKDSSADQIEEIMRRYHLTKLLPRTILDCLENSFSEIKKAKPGIENWQVLLENRDGVRAAQNYLLDKNFIVEAADDLIETPIAAGCAALVERLLKLREKSSPEKAVALISGGEFMCPVRGSGRGGRSTESALRTAILFDELREIQHLKNIQFAALFAGTDGVDGNSPAAGAAADETTLDRARKLNLNAAAFLESSDSYGFFDRLGDAVETGATGTNVRDLRILLAAKSKI